jgi:hypothetical protein
MNREHTLHRAEATRADASARDPVEVRGKGERLKKVGDGERKKIPAHRALEE